MRSSLFFALSIAILFVSINSVSAQLATGWKAHDLQRPQAKLVTPADKVGGAPSDAIVLFSEGGDLSKWRAASGGEAKWKIVDGAMESVPRSGFIVSKEEFGDCQVHVEFASPKTVKGNGQGRGNSGVFLMGEFEVQVLDSFENKTYVDGSAGSIYGQHPPLVNASRGPGEWQSYDIIFRRPRFNEAGELTSAARITVLHNGVLIQNNSEAFGPTNWIRHKEYKTMLRKGKARTKGPLSFQDHGNPVRYRNVWVRPLIENPPQPKTAYDPTTIELDIESAKKLVGKYGNRRVELVDGKLIYVFNSIRLDMVAKSKTEFSFSKTAGWAKFEIDDSGEAISMESSLDAAGKQKADREK
ncbi:MAG: DUF1080 domain-containing protein [Mariniblastus sp.]